MKFELGEMLQDKVTGFKGVAISRAEYLTDSTSYGLCCRTLKDGVPMEVQWFDKSRLERIANAEKMVLGMRG